MTDGGCAAYAIFSDYACRRYVANEISHEDVSLRCHAGGLGGAEELRSIRSVAARFDQPRIQFFHVWAPGFPRGMVSMQDIKHYCDAIEAALKPEKIILFGSYADGESNEDSDVDVLVVMPKKR